MRTKFRTVPDTNVIIASQNASATSPNREYFERWENDEFALLYSTDTLDEYVRKLVERGVARETIHLSSTITQTVSFRGASDEKSLQRSLANSRFRDFSLRSK